MTQAETHSRGIYSDLRQVKQRVQMDVNGMEPAWNECTMRSVVFRKSESYSIDMAGDACGSAASGNRTDGSVKEKSVIQ